MKLYCPRRSLLIQESPKLSKYSLTNPNLKNHSIESKMIFKKENPKMKESIFNLIRNTKKNQIRKEQNIVNKNKITIKNYIDVLNDAHIDEGIVLNQYFAYLKKYNIEYSKSQQIKLKQILIPIKNQEKSIKNMKRSIKFYKSISNHMIMKYMVENKDKFNKYMNEISSYKTRNSISHNHNKKRFSTEKNISTSRINDNKSVFKTYFNYGENLKYKNSYLDKNNKNDVNRNNISNLKLKIGDSSSLKNKNTLSTYLSRKNTEHKNSKGSSVTLDYNRTSINVNNKYYTPFRNKKKFTNISDNNKNNEIFFNRSEYKTQKYKYSID